MILHLCKTEDRFSEATPLECFEVERREDK